jgi:hypothetical protein
MRKGIIIAILLSILLIGCTAREVIEEKDNEINVEQIIEIVKTDKDYDDFLAIVPDFEAELESYTKLSPADYEEVKPEWNKTNSTMYGMSDIIDTLKLTNSTYLVKLKDKNNENKGLIAVVDVEKNRSLILYSHYSYL